LIIAHSQTIYPDNICGFRVAIRVTHPQIFPDSITQKLGRTPDVAHAVGTQRMTPKGTVLPGVYRESHWLLHGPVSEYLTPLIEWANEIIEGSAPFIDELISTGGRLEYFIGCFVSGQIGASLEPLLIRKCANLGVTLVFDIYGGERPELAFEE
jgi:hypothetical protein